MTSRNSSGSSDCGQRGKAAQIGKQNGDLSALIRLRVGHGRRRARRRRGAVRQWQRACACDGRAKGRRAPSDPRRSSRGNIAKSTSLSANARAYCSSPKAQPLFDIHRRRRKPFPEAAFLVGCNAARFVLAAANTVSAPPDPEIRRIDAAPKLSMNRRGAAHCSSRTDYQCRRHAADARGNLTRRSPRRILDCSLPATSEARPPHSSGEHREARHDRFSLRCSCTLAPRRPARRPDWRRGIDARHALLCNEPRHDDLQRRSCPLCRTGRADRARQLRRDRAGHRAHEFDAPEHRAGPTAMRQRFSRASRQASRAACARTADRTQTDPVDRADGHRAVFGRDRHRSFTRSVRRGAAARCSSCRIRW